jgi:hypothetical protein
MDRFWRLGREPLEAICLIEPRSPMAEYGREDNLALIDARFRTKPVSTTPYSLKQVRGI